VDQLEINRARGLLIHIEEQQTQAVKELFKKLGGNYENGSNLILNANFWPEYSSRKIHQRVHFSDDLPNHILAIFVEPLTQNFRFGV